MSKNPATGKPAKKKRKLTVNQKAAFQSPITQPKRADDVVPHHARMGVKVYG